MTKRERAQLRRAISDVTSEDRFDRGYVALLRLAGMRSPAHEAMRQAKGIPIIKAARGPNCSFKWIDPKPMTVPPPGRGG